MVCNLQFDRPKKVTKHVSARKLKNIDMGKFRLDVSDVSSSVLADQSDVNDLANRFADFWQEIIKLRDKLMLATSEDLSVELNYQCQSRLHVFQEVSEEDVNRIIKSSS